MPSRATAVAKVVICATTNSSSRPGTAPSRTVVTQPRGPTQQTLSSSSPKTPLLSASSLFESFHFSPHRHHHRHHPSTQMDAAFAKLFVSNSQWVGAVKTAEPGFFEQSAKGQSPKVRQLCFHHSVLTPRAFFCYHAHIHSCPRRSSGSDARTPASPRVSSLPRDQVIFSFTAISPSTLPFGHHQTHFRALTRIYA
jgi:hypothetical protein